MNPKLFGRAAHRVAAMGGVCALATAAGLSGASAQDTPTQATVIGNIESWVVNAPNDRFAGATMMVGGQTIILPRNLVIDLPANRLTAREFVDLAPPNCSAAGETGLAAADLCQGQAKTAVGVATIFGNRIANGDIVAGEVLIEKGQELITGVVTGIDHQAGVIYVGGAPGEAITNCTVNACTGTPVRINDPDARFTLQRNSNGSRGCAPGNGNNGNCSADPRFGVDPDNFTSTFATGYPACIPSARDAGNFAGSDRVALRPAGTRSNNNGAGNGGLGDLFCPLANRSGNPADLSFAVPAATGQRMAPIQVGDHVAVEGNIETVGGGANAFTFLSAHTVSVHSELTTGAGQPNYFIFDEAEWDTTGFQNERVRMLLIGFGSEIGPNGNPEVYSVDIDPADFSITERLIASTAGCEASEGAGTCAAQGIAPNGANITRIRYDVDFIAGVPDDRRSPCMHLNGLEDTGAFFLDGSGSATIPFITPCANDGTFVGDGNGAPPEWTIQEDAYIIMPIARDIIARTRRRHDNLTAFAPIDLTGNDAPWGEYLNPVGVGHPEFVEINLAAINTPFIFSGQPWLLDRRSGPGGDDLATDALDDQDFPYRLNPFPYSCLDPAGQLVAAVAPGGVTNFRNRLLAIPSDIPLQGEVGYPDPDAGVAGNLLNWQDLANKHACPAP